MPRKPPTLQKKIKAFLRSHGITQRELAMGIDLSPSSLSTMLNGKTSLSVDRFIEICEFIGVVPGELLDDYVEELFQESQKDLVDQPEKKGA